MAAIPNEKRIDELCQLLNRLDRLHEELLAQTRARIAAMKINDLSAMHRATEEEHRLIERISEQDGLRRQLMAAIGRDAGWPPHEARMLSASQLAARCAAPQRKRLLDIAAGLRTRFTEVARAARISSSIASGILQHITQVFSDVRQRECRSVGYSGSGTSVAVPTGGAFEVVG